MNPAGFPFLAGRMVTLRISPGFMEVLLIPSRVSVVTEAVVRIQSVTLPSLSGTVSSMLACGFVKFNFLSTALEDHLFVQVVHTRHGMMGLQGDAGCDKADHQESAHYKAVERFVNSWFYSIRRIVVLVFSSWILKTKLDSMRLI